MTSLRLLARESLTFELKSGRGASAGRSPTTGAPPR